MAEEKKIEMKFKGLVEARGWKALKLVCPGYDGMPDRIVLKSNGQVFFVEIKAPGEEPRLLQKIRAVMLRSLGHRVYTIDSMDRAYDVLRIEEQL